MLCRNEAAAVRSEEDFLQLINAFFPAGHRDVLLQRGDDCAVLRCRDTLCLSSDLFLEHSHFKLDYFSPRDVGYKCLAANISDISAMGARPQGFTLSLMAPEGVDRSFWEAFFQGLAELASEHDLYLAGGDLCRSRQMGMDIAIWGASEKRYLRRGQGRSGDLLFLLGSMGLARTGLSLLESTGRIEGYERAVQAHLRPQLFVRQALQLADLPEVLGLMDVSDGLARDLPRFLAPGTGAALRIQEESLAPDVLRYARQTGSDPLAFALAGGEDYALLGAVDRNAAHRLQEIDSGFAVIGEIVSREGIWVNEAPLAAGGFDHFASRDRHRQGLS